MNMQTLYMLTMDGNNILDKPLPLSEITSLFGSIHRLEKEGFRLVKSGV